MSQTTDIMNVLVEGEEYTATGIAKLLGFSKANVSLKQAIEDLVDSNQLTVDDSGRYTIYMINSNTNAQVGGQSNTTQVKIKRDIVPPTADLQRKGYDARREGDQIVVTCPGNRETVIEEDETLIVINDIPYAVVNDPKDVVTVISEFTESHGYRTAVIKDLQTNQQISVSGDVILGESRILALTIKKHNKAA